jgi:hypothetical protein
VFLFKYFLQGRALRWLPMIACLLVAACGNLPQPFARTNAGDNPLLAPGERAGINVITVAGTPHGALIAKEIAQALRDEGFAAQARARLSTGYTLVGRATITPAKSTGKAQVRLLWLVLNIRGRPGGIHHQELTVDRAAWNRGAQPLLQRLARDAVSGLAPLMSDAHAAAPVRKSQPIIVFDVDGAPGDGRVALRRSLAFELRKLKYAVTETVIQGAAPIVLLGAVKVSAAAKANTQRVEITWTVLAPDGHVLGTIKQTNDVKSGSLVRSWGGTAALAARAAAPGIAKIISRAASVAPTEQK